MLYVANNIIVVIVFPIYKDLKCDGSQERTHCNNSSIKSFAPPTFQWNLDVLVDTLLCRLTKYQNFTHSAWVITTVKEKPWCDGSQECTQCNKSSIKQIHDTTSSHVVSSLCYQKWASADDEFQSAKCFERVEKE